MASLRAFRLKLAFLSLLAVAFALSGLLSVSAQELNGGWEDIAISEDMVGRSISSGTVKGSCNVVQAWGAYSTKRPASQTEGNWIRLHWQEDSRTITKDMAGFGLRLFTPENTKCSLGTKGYTDNLGKASKLSSGWNFISVSKSMLQKSFSGISNTCSISKVRLYSPATCAGVRENPDSLGEPCDGDYLMIEPETKLIDFYLGKGIWVKVASDCTLDDGTPTEVLCSEAECAAKSGCYDTQYLTYGCSNKECTPLSSRECTEKEKEALKGVNLVPEIVINPSEGLKSGDTIEITFYIKNIGAKEATQYGMKEKGTTTLSNLVYFYKSKEYGPEALPQIYAPISVLLLPDSAIKPGEAGKVQLAKQTVKIPDGFSGDLVIAAVVDAQFSYHETNEDDNRLKVALNVQKPGPASLPDLAATKIEAVPKVESFPAPLSSVNVFVENKGKITAVAEKQFLEIKISILKGSTEICKDSRVQLVAIKSGESERFSLWPKSVTGQDSCNLDDKSANYRAVVEVDTLNAVAESDENNKFTFAIKEELACSPLGGREGGEYCSISAAKWKEQKEAGQSCMHNFECKTELCVKQKCVSETQKKDILKILGIG